MQFFALVENNVEQPACDWSRERTKRFGDDETAFDIFDREGQCVDQRIGGNMPVIFRQMLGVHQHLDGRFVAFTVDQDLRGELIVRAGQCIGLCRCDGLQAHHAGFGLLAVMHGQRKLAHLHRNQQRIEIVGIELGFVETYARTISMISRMRPRSAAAAARLARLAARSAIALEAFANCPPTLFMAPAARSLSFESTPEPFVNFRHSLEMADEYNPGKIVPVG